VANYSCAPSIGRVQSGRHYQADREGPMRHRLWRMVSGARFVNIVHDVALVGGTIFAAVYMHWLFGRR
jgi:hypothetical protein